MAGKRSEPTHSSASLLHTRASVKTRERSPSAETGTVRLQKFLAESGVASRRHAEKLIQEGQVTVNGVVVTTLGTKIDPVRDSVIVAKKRVRPEKKVLYLFYKPLHVVTTMNDPQGRPCIADFTARLLEKVFPVGRLDFDACGLLLLTNDGDYADRLLHPRYGVRRTYWLRVAGKVSDGTLRSLCAGIELDDGPGKAVSARHIGEKQFHSLVPLRRTETRGRTESEQLESDYLELAVEEGRKHFVKRLLAAVGHPVRQLCRVSYGEYRLGDMSPGQLLRVDFK
jgi:pseudouridine synthase